MKTVTLKSGNTMEVNIADFPEAWALAQAIASQLGETLSLAKLGSIKELMEMDMESGPVIGSLLKLLASKETFALVWPCLARCTYNGAKITPETFQEERTRKDFLPCVVEMCKVSVVPFIDGLDLKSLTGQVNKKAGNQK